ncbi:MAG: VCBS repeat-containing protein, partial [Deltaproteobacteria bacterium]|nr:VCBS repeat-containing protein [Deltaproteobacteria bacterium]
DGDGRPDVVSAGGICGYWDRSFGFDGHRCFPVNAYDAAGKILLGFPKSTPGPGTTNGITPAIADLDGDGLKEIVWIDFLGNLLVWNVPGIPGPEKMQWPMYRHDAAHTGALVTNP